MKYKLPSNRNQLRFLKQLINTNTTLNGGFVINDDFIGKFKFTKEQIFQMLNALDSKGLVDMMPPGVFCPHPYVVVTQKAFAYIPDHRENMLRFWTPIIISLALSIIATAISVMSLIL